MLCIQKISALQLHPEVFYRNYQSFWIDEQFCLFLLFGRQLLSSIPFTLLLCYNSLKILFYLWYLCWSLLTVNFSYALCYFFVTNLMTNLRIIQKKLTPYLTVVTVSIGGWPNCNLQLADNNDLLGGSKRLEKTVAVYGMETGSNKCKILINSIIRRPSTNIWMNGKVLEEVEIWLMQAHSAVTRLTVQCKRKQPIFLQSLNSTNHLSHQCCSMDADCRSGETNTSLWKQILKEDAWYIVQRAQNEHIRMATGQYPCWISGIFCQM